MIGSVWGGDVRRDGQLQMPTTVARGYVIYPDPRGHYAVVAVREHVYGDADDSSWTQSRRDDTSAGHRLDRVVVEQVAMDPDVALDAAIDLWDESGLPVCLYLKNFGKVVFDDFSETVLGYDEDGVVAVGKCLGYAEGELHPYRVDVNLAADEAIEIALGLDPNLPKPPSPLFIYFLVPDAAIDVWREQSRDNPDAQGLNYVINHPMVKGSIRAYFDLYSPTTVEIAFDVADMERATHVGWYDHNTGVARLNYGAFAIEYILATLGISFLSPVDVLDSFAATLVHELTHHAERVTGFPYKGTWSENAVVGGRRYAAEGSEKLAEGAAYTALYAMRHHDSDFIREQMGNAFGITEAISDIADCAILSKFGAAIVDVKNISGRHVQVYGRYVPWLYEPRIEFVVTFSAPEEVFDLCIEALQIPDVTLTGIAKTTQAQPTPDPIHEVTVVTATYEVWVPVPELTWIQQAFLKYADRDGHKNEMIG
jgi:hypothetical protein